jgi:hypothetical protein
MMCTDRFVPRRDYPRQVCWLLLLGCVPWSGCQSVPVDSGRAPVIAEVYQPASSVRTPTTAVTHRPTHARRFSASQRLNPVWWFGNVDEPVAPDWYRPGDCRRNTLWRVRNPGHNFTFYVIGIADKEFIRVGRHPTHVSNPHEGWNWAVCHYKWLRLPFLSYHRGGFKFYCGWRNAGNFGMKLNYVKKKKVPPAKPENYDTLSAGCPAG